MTEVVDLTQDEPDDSNTPPVRGLTPPSRPSTTRFSPLRVPSATQTPLPHALHRSVTRLPAARHALLLQKQNWLRSHTISVNRSSSSSSALAAIAATLAFAQPEAGTAVCIEASGVLLTCAHCIAETADELDWAVEHWLLFAAGEIVAARAVAWDPVRDLAVLRITKSQPPPSQSPSSPIGLFPSIPISSVPPSPRARLICVGQPGAEDLESSTPGTPTDYGILHISQGTFRGLAAGQDPLDNSEIGALIHSCWTYWGHSGAPLALAAGGRGVALVGLHSSWDDETGDRRGVPWEAVTAFLGLVEVRFRGRGIERVRFSRA